MQKLLEDDEREYGILVVWDLDNDQLPHVFLKYLHENVTRAMNKLRLDF